MIAAQIFDAIIPYFDINKRNYKNVQAIVKCLSKKYIIKEIIEG
jgi:hypothetical protein